jgi:excisionase family DNA binding protein
LLAGRFYFSTQEMIDVTQLYTATEVAKMLRVKKNYVYELVYSKQLDAIRLSERRFRFTQAAIDKYIKEHRN